MGLPHSVLPTETVDEDCVTNSKVQQRKRTERLSDRICPILRRNIQSHPAKHLSPLAEIFRQNFPR